MLLSCTLLAGLVLLPGCKEEVLFRSNFDPTPVDQPPAHAQQIGTADIDGPAGHVTVVGPPVAPSNKWVRIRRPTNEDPVAGLKCNVQPRGDGEYRFSSFLLVPSGSGVATIQFEPTAQGVGDLTHFLHLDFMQDNRVRIDDKEETKFGTFARDQAFIVQVTLEIDASPTAHIVLSGAGTSGVADYSITGVNATRARQFGAARLWMGFPWTGSFLATNIVVSLVGG